MESKLNFDFLLLWNTYSLEHGLGQSSQFGAYMLISTLILLAGVANCFEQQASKSSRIFIPCSFPSTRAIISSTDLWKYFIMFSCINHAFYFKVYHRDLKSAVQKNIDKTYSFPLFWGSYFYYPLMLPFFNYYLLIT